MKFRLLNKLFANLFGYFWLTCPNCGKYFGGHEINFSPFGKVKLVKSSDGYYHSMCVCPDCEKDTSFKGDFGKTPWDEEASKRITASSSDFAEGEWL